MSRTTVHETLTFERILQCPAATLWKAFADPMARSRWGAPSPSTVIIYEEADFRVGGRDRSRCGAKEDPHYLVDVTYLDIQPEQRIVFSERVADGAVPLSGALHTIELEGSGSHTSLKVTVQIASFGGADMVGGVRQGMTAALSNLALECADLSITANH